MTRFLNPLMAMLSSILLIGAAISPAAAASGPAYRLLPVTALTSARTFVASEVIWTCGPDGCVAGAASSRPTVVCAQAARAIGKLASFSAGPQAFDAAALAKCNAKAK
jgi:hypothetical protein